VQRRPPLPRARSPPDHARGLLDLHARQGRALAEDRLNHLNFTHGLFEHARDRGWASANPVAAVKRPRQLGADPDIRFLDVAELDALIRAIPDDELGAVELALYLTAALTGPRQGELIALRWRDVDWTAGLIRVRRSITRDKLGKPKSKRSSRAVPMADRVAAELERHFQRSAFQ
jgi:integrase